MKADDILFDAREKLSECWKDIYPKGKLPDKIGAALYEIAHLYYVELCRVKREQTKGGRGGC